MKTSIALVSAALLLGTWLARRPADVPPPLRPARPPRAVETAPAPEATSFLGTLAGALLPSLGPEPEPAREFIGVVSPRFTTYDRMDDLDQDLLAIHRKLDTMKVDLAFEDTKIEDILAFLRDFSGLNILLDAACRDRIDPDRLITFRVKNLILKKILKLLLAPYQLDVRVTEENVVLITDPGTAATAAPDLFSAVTNLAVTSGPTAENPYYAVLDATRVDLDVQNWPLTAVVDELRKRTGLDLQLLPPSDDEVVSVKVSQMSLRQLLSKVFVPRNMAWGVDGVTVWIGRY